MSAPRVAFFTDSFHEINGVALTSREFVSYARRRSLPFFLVRGGTRTRCETEGTVSSLEFERGRMSVEMDRGLHFDPFFLRHLKYVQPRLAGFRPDLVHITSPGDAGILGALLAHRLRVPLVASWHTNLHEFAARRSETALAPLGRGLARRVASRVESLCWKALVRFYRLGRVLLAPNQELIDLLHAGTGRPVFLMRRGVDTELFHPSRRDRANGPFTIGFVGRVTPEKNVRFFFRLEEALRAAGRSGYRLLIVGDGSERRWLAENLPNAELPGVLRGEALARAYANMDLFVFPSETDTFGNVVQEALASGVPAVVTAGGGPKYLVESGSTGYVAHGERALTRCVLEAMANPEQLEAMKAKARLWASQQSWDAVFERVYAAYAYCLNSGAAESSTGAPNAMRQGVLEPTA